MSSSELPRSIVLLVLAVASVGEYGATYRGLREILGFRSEDAVRACVRRGRAHGAVVVLSTGRGQRARAIIRLSPRALEMFERMELPRVQRDDA